VSSRPAVSFQAELNRRIVEIAGDPAGILSLADAHLHELNDVNCATALNR
jgi:hypothetical protein